MPICQNCHKQWTWKQTMKNVFQLNCPYCKEKQFLAVASRKKTSIFALTPPFILCFNLFFQLSWWFLVIIVIILLVIQWLLYPFMVELENERQPIW